MDVKKKWFSGKREITASTKGYVILLSCAINKVNYLCCFNNCHCKYLMVQKLQDDKSK